MKKLSIFLLLIVFLLLGCTSIKQGDKFYLNNRYYNKGEYIDINKKELKRLKNKSYILFTYNNYCTMSTPCENVFKEFMNKYKIDIVSIPYEEFKDTKFSKTVKYAPSVLIIQKGKIISYLDAESDEDLSKYQNEEDFENWIKEYIYVKK